MENHQNHKVEPKPDIEKNHHHRHQQQQQHRNEAWGTWEELLLACAVNRHGFKDWHAVAMEVQSRTTRFLATARHCEQKFHDLSHRFADQCNDDVPPPPQNSAAAAISDHVPWLDELRKLRVAELRLEVVAVGGEEVRGGESEGERWKGRQETGSGGFRQVAAGKQRETEKAVTQPILRSLLENWLGGLRETL